MRVRKEIDYFSMMPLITFLIIVLMTGSLDARSGQRIAGTVKAVGKDSVTIETAGHKQQTIKVGSKTKFFRHKKSSNLGEMKPGDHVVFTVKPYSAAQTETAAQTSSTNNDCSAALTNSSTSAVKGSSTNSAQTTKDTLSLGLGFCAVQASY